MSNRANLARGFSLIELMIGLTVGLFILIGASSLMISQITDHRRLTLETRTEQDMRAIAELMTQELRRAGAWEEPSLGVWSEVNSTPQPNPYAPITISSGGRSIEFSYWPGSGPLPITKGFKLDGNVIRSLEGTSWQPLNDPETLKVTKLNARLEVTTQTLESACAVPCDGAANCPPSVDVRELLVDVAAQAAHDEGVKRDFSLRLRLPSDRMRGACRAS